MVYTMNMKKGYIHLHVLIRPEHKELVQMLAKRQDRTVSATLRMILDEYMPEDQKNTTS